MAREQADLVNGVVITQREWIFFRKHSASCSPYYFYCNVYSHPLVNLRSFQFHIQEFCLAPPANQPTTLTHQSPQCRPPAHLSSTPFSHCRADKQQTLHPSKQRTPAWHPDRHGTMWATNWYCWWGYCQCHAGIKMSFITYLPAPSWVVSVLEVLPHIDVQ